VNLANFPVYTENSSGAALVSLGEYSPYGAIAIPRSTYRNYIDLENRQNYSPTGQLARDYFGTQTTQNIPYTIQVPGTQTVNGLETPDGEFAWSSPGEGGLRQLLFGGQQVDQSDIRAFVPDAAPSI